MSTQKIFKAISLVRRESSDTVPTMVITDAETDGYPVFLLSPTPRSGTNFFFSLLRDTGLFRLSPNPVFRTEDFLIAKSGWLFHYVHELETDWRNMETEEEDVQRLKQEVIQRLGKALMDAAGLEPGKPLLLKTPLLYQVERARELFPTCKLIILVRDGRDTTESAFASGFQDMRKAAFEDWADRVRALLKFTGRSPLKKPGDHWLVVRYEDALREPGSVLEKVADFLGTTLPDGYAPNIEALPVYGSSKLGQRPRTKFKFRILPRPADFNPVGRWQDWDEATRKEFKACAGRELAALGYGGEDGW